MQKGDITRQNMLSYDLLVCALMTGLNAVSHNCTSNHNQRQRLFLISYMTNIHQLQTISHYNS